MVDEMSFLVLRCIVAVGACVVFGSYSYANDSVTKAVSLIDQLPQQWPMAPINPAVPIPAKVKKQASEAAALIVELSVIESEILVSAYKSIQTDILKGNRSHHVERKLLLLNKALFDVPAELSEHSVYLAPLRGTLRNGPLRNGQTQAGTWPWTFRKGEISYSLDRRPLFFQGRYDFVEAFNLLNTKFSRRAFLVGRNKGGGTFQPKPTGANEMSESND